MAQSPKNSGIRSFKDKGTEDIYFDRNTKHARSTLPINLWGIARRKLDMLDEAESLTELGYAPGNRLESLKGERVGQHSIRINDQYRVCFIFGSDGFHSVEIIDYH
jgi:proteic killer suppression protein